MCVDCIPRPRPQPENSMAAIERCKYKINFLGGYEIKINVPSVVLQDHEQCACLCVV